MKKVLLVGFDPAVVDYTKVKFTEDEIRSMLKADTERLIGLGYDATMFFIDLGATAEQEVRKCLAAESFDCVLIGAGVRTFPEHLLLFEKLVNVIHQAAPNASICFNTNPGDTAAAVMRWV